MANRLAKESSPYLLQHKDNPVDWYPWSDEALQLAKSQDKPIFLSVGYSACHWCHVMEHESFENDSIAILLNENFVCIKVDREERPDIDHIYMQAVMAMRGGQGGWPLSAFLTPNQEVFFGGTYWPPRASRGLPGFDHVITQVAEAYRTNRDAVNQQSQQISEFVSRKSVDAPDEYPVNDSLLLASAAQLERNYDFDNGGFGSAPKFPHPMDLQLLLQLWRRWPDSLTPPRDQLLHMVEFNLQRMAHGGIFDHLAGGFARYSVDEKWLVPHFEKMLYDNAQLAKLYVQMKQVTGNEFYESIARETLDYLLAYMTGAQGEFHSTEDADSEGEEGKFYVWSVDEVLEILGSETGKRFCELYDVTMSGNFEGRNILNLPSDYGAFADKHGLDDAALREDMRLARQKLLAVRDQRVRPGKDDKVLVSWNALAIDAFATAAIVFGENRYLDAAAKAAKFVLNDIRNEDGRLLHTSRHGKARLAAYLDDYAYFVNSLLTLFSADADPQWYEHAIELSDQMVRHFHDPENGGFFFTANDQPELFTRYKDDQDSSVPSGNAMAALAMLRLGQLNNNSHWREISESTLRFTANLMHRAPLATGQSLVVSERLLDEEIQLVLVVAQMNGDARDAIKSVQKPWLPNATFLLVNLENPFDCESLDNVLQGKNIIDDLPTLYVCHNFSCELPAVGQAEIERAMGNLANNPLCVGDK